MLVIHYSKKHIIVSLTLLFIMIISLISYTCSNMYQNKSISKSNLVYSKLLLQSIKNYEGYIRTNEDSRYCYKPQQGYPMYLYTFGMMYYRLFLIDRNEYYKNKFISTIEAAEKI